MDHFYLENTVLYQKLVGSIDAGAPTPHFSRHVAVGTVDEDVTPEHPDMIVSARIRPMLDDDMEAGFPCAVYPRLKQNDSAQLVDVHDLYHHPRQRPLLKSTMYRVDRLFDDHATTETIYHSMVSDLVSFAKSGGIATLLAYGQTGSGKTFTINELQRLTVKSLIDTASDSDNQCTPYITVSELAGNSAFDLLNSRKSISVLEDSSGITRLKGAQESRLGANDDVFHLLDQAASFRQTAATMKNDASSRSHSICCIRFDRSNTSASPKPSGDDGMLYLVDLAGSEAARDVAQHGADRMRETKEINVSLSALKDCLRGRAKLEMTRRAGRHKEVHIPIRRSTLTRVLKHVFDPQEWRPCKTAVIACVNPSLGDVGPSKNTLRYAEMLGSVSV